MIKKIPKNIKGEVILDLKELSNYVADCIVKGKEVELNIEDFIEIKNDNAKGNKMTEKYNVKYELDYSNRKINQVIFDLKENGELESFCDTIELSQNYKKPGLNQIVKINFQDAILYGKIVLIFEMQSGCYEVQVQFIDVIKNKE